MTNPQSDVAEARSVGEQTKPRRSGWWWLSLAVAVIALDQITKAWILRHFAYDERVEILPVLNFTLRFNPGAAFSFLADAGGWQRWY